MRPSSSSLPEFSLNFVVNGYRIIKLISSGLNSDVYLVFSEKYQVEFAMKVIDIKTINLQSDWSAFNGEITTLKMLDHPNIIRLYDYFVDSNCIYIILEYCKNGSLFEFIQQNGPLTFEKAIIISYSIVSALLYSHSKGISHRDIKPHNILFDSHFRPKLADFGISIQLIETEVTFNHSCSPAFAPPELLKKLPFCPFKADIWSLGLTFFFLLSGFISNGKIDNLTFAQYVLKGSKITSNSFQNSFFDLILSMLNSNPLKRISLFNLEIELKELLPIKLSENIVEVKKKKKLIFQSYSLSNSIKNSTFRVQYQQNRNFLPITLSKSKSISYRNSSFID